MIIQKIEISNFRGIREKKEFVFDGKPFILLSAPNGLGKTTLIDAIEWCFTGTIGRLKAAYDSRSTNNDERKKNLKGILKNKSANSSDKICVILQIADGNGLEEIKRTQEKDELNEDFSTLWVNGQKDPTRSVLKKFVGNNFYNFHFCDVQKSIGMQSKKRKELPELFSDFISDYSKELIVADNLEVFADDAKRYFDDLENEKVSDKEIVLMREQLEKYIGTSAIREYPNIQIYEAENLEVKSLDEKGLKQQLQKIYECGYVQVKEILIELVSDSNARENIRLLEKINDILTEKRTQVERAVKEELHIGTEKILNCEQNIKNISEIKLTDKNIWDYSTKLLEFSHNNFTKERYNLAKKEIEDIEQKVHNLEIEINTLSKGSKILDLFSDLIAKRGGFEEYREDALNETGQAKCPVCGAVQFGQIETEELLYGASEYVNQHSALLKQKKIEQTQLKEQLSLLYEKLLNTCNQVLTDNVRQYEAKKEQLILLQNNTKEFFEDGKKLENIDSEKYTIEKLLSEGYVNNALRDLQERLFSDDIIMQKQIEYKKILELLEYKMQENETEKSTIQRIGELEKNAPKVINFDYSLLVQKINSINSLIGNQEYLAIQNNIDTALKKNENIVQQQNELGTLQAKANKHAETIYGLVGKLREDEYNSVGPNLYKFYKKLSRINTIENIQIRLDDENLSLEDESGSNVVNILSNGQLSVFMLAYFFAGIVSRSNEEPCKIYFIDDLTACMDDVNMLAFLDLMKYQLLAKNGTIEQLFFASCDERISRLLRYKLGGCGVDYCELQEKNFL